MCDSVLETVRGSGAEVEFYPLSKRLLPRKVPKPGRDELFLVVNYFGVQGAYARSLAARLGDRLVIDNTQAFFDRPYGSWAFNSARKFFGVADGAYLYGPIKNVPEVGRNRDADIRHLVNRLRGLQATAYRQLLRKESMVSARIQRISILSERLLDTVNYSEVRLRRRENYRLLHSLLGKENLFGADLPHDATPFCYPLLLRCAIDRASLARLGLYVSSPWPEVIRRRGAGYELERMFARHLLPLPIDHRYSGADMFEVVTRLDRVLRSQRLVSP
jgi:hypothetical protein